MDQGGRIQSIQFTVLFGASTKITGCGLQTLPNCSVSFAPAGVLGNLHPTSATLVKGTSSVKIRYTFNDSTDSIPYNLDTPKPGDLIGFLSIGVAGSATDGTISLAIDPTPEATSFEDNLLTGTSGRRSGAESIRLTAP